VPPRPSRSTAFADLPSALHSLAPNADGTCPHARTLPARWARIGGLSGVGPYPHVIDLERLIVATAACDDAGLRDIAASWLAVHHALVFGRRLAGMAGALANAHAPAAATLGVILDRECAAALSLPDDVRLRPESLEIARGRCSSRTPAGASGRGTSTPGLIEPVEWLVQRVPELRVRALLGATLEAEIMIVALARHASLTDEDVGDAPVPNVGAVARHAGVSYGGVHGAANRLVRRGLLVRHGERRQVVLRPTAFALSASGWSEVRVERA
jgi:hypothetical protein